MSPPPGTGLRERLFTKDRLSKREQVEATLSHQPVDRAVLHEQLRDCVAKSGAWQSPPANSSVNCLRIQVRVNHDLC